VIDRVVQRPFLLWQVEALAATADDASPAVDLPPETADVTPEELAEVRRHLAEAVAHERAKPMTPPPVAAEDDRRGEEAPPIEVLSFIPRDAVLSLAQSAIERFLEEHRSDLLIPLTHGPGDNDRREDTAISPGPDFSLDLADDAIPGDDEEDRRLGGAFEITDPRWVSSVIAMGWRKLHKRCPFKNEPAAAAKLASNARVVVVGDWATGIQRARKVAKEIAVALAEATLQERDCHVIHLGDTYYAGWDYEYRKRFLPWWPVKPGEPHGSWSLNGNHDMYAGGWGYFEALLADERFSAQQGSSWFSLENEHWQLLGLDTAYSEHALAGEQATWVERRLADREHPDRRTMLLSHHQLFSAFGDGGPKLEAALHRALATDRIDAWFWGHEHRCVVYEPQQHVRFASCVGHGGVPVYAEHGPRPGVRWYLEKSFRAGVEEWALFGFAILDFDGPTVKVSYRDEFGGPDNEDAIQ
jgi:Calcineurin-like phosphoesterase